MASSIQGNGSASNTWNTNNTSSTTAQDVNNQLTNAGAGQAWGPAFDQAVQAAGIGNAVATGGAVVTGANVQQPFAGYRRAR